MYCSSPLPRPRNQSLLGALDTSQRISHVLLHERYTKPVLQLQWDKAKVPKHKRGEHVSCKAASKVGNNTDMGV